MGDLKTQNTSYPASKDIATLFADLTDQIVAQNQNGPNTAIVAMQNEMGIGLKGTMADLATRLAVNTGADGGIVQGTSDPAPASRPPCFLYRTDTNKLKVYNPSTGQWDEFTTTTGLASYLRVDVPNTITAVHTFAPTTATNSPFLVAALAAMVPNLDADKVDGQHRVLTINADHTHTATGAMGGIVDHVSLASIGSNTHAQIDTFVSTAGSLLATATSTASANALVMRTSGKDVLDRNGLALFASASNLSYTSSANLSLSSPNIAVNSGDILLVASSISCTIGGTGVANFYIQQSGVTATWLQGNSGTVTDSIYSVNGAGLAMSIFSVLFVASTGNLVLTSAISGLSPTGISNLLGWSFLKKQ